MLKQNDVIKIKGSVVTASDKKVSLYSSHSTKQKTLKYLNRMCKMKHV